MDDVLRSGRNAWVVERAHRAAVLVDGSAYFAAVRSAMRRAQRAIYIVGWDLDSRTELIDDRGRTEDRLPRRLGDFLSALVSEKPSLVVKLLVWDYSMFYALEREPWPNLSLQWTTPDQIELCFDDVLPIGCSHHQKLVVIDDAIAFCGGLDLTVRRWDTPRHRPRDRRRRDPSGVPYPPFHDVQMLVDGPVAAALGDLVRFRWRQATSEDLPSVRADGDPWPQDVAPDFRNVRIGVSRTLPACGEMPEVREIESLFADMIATARHSIYIENQFLTCASLAGQLARKLRDTPSLELVIVAPKRHHTWVEHSSMGPSRRRFAEILRGAGADRRLRIVHPQISRGRSTTEIMVHSKVMIVDDRLLRIGSANLCNRSMGTDSECDLVLEAASELDRRAIAQVRNRLLAEHCGVATADVESTLQSGGSLVTLVDSRKERRHLVPMEPVRAEWPEPALQIQPFTDPERPLALAEFLAGRLPSNGNSSRWSRVTMLSFAVAAVALLVVAWRYTELRELARPSVVGAWFMAAAGTVWAPLIIVATFVVAGLVFFPVTVLIAATGAAFGAWPGAGYAGVATMISALVTYFIGWYFGTGALRRLVGPRLTRISIEIAKRGVLAMTGVRLVPVAPFTLVNLIAGAIRIPVLDYLVGTALGIAPGLLLMTLLGEQLLRFLAAPSLVNLGTFLAIVIAWAGVALGLQTVLARIRR